MPVNADASYEQWKRFVYCRDNGHIDFLNKANKCDQFTVGEQWRPEDLDKLKAQNRPGITINKILSTVSNILGEQIKNRTEVLFRPKHGSPAETAEALTKVWMHLSQENQLPWKRSDVFFDGIVRSRGFYDMRLDFTDSMQGELKIEQLNGKNVVIDPDAYSYDPDGWNDVFITKWMSGQEISIMYNEEDGEYLTSRDSGSFVYGFDSMDRARDRFGSIITPASYLNTNDIGMIRRNVRVIERQYKQLDKQLHFVDVETGDMRAVPVGWDRDRIADLLSKAGGTLSTTKKLVQRIKWTVTADNVLLHDDWSPYRHYTVVPYFPYFRYGKTVGIVENLLGPQEILNKVSSQELHIVNTTANSGWVVEANSLVNMSTEELEQKGATTGLVIEHAKGSAPPTKIQPNQTPTGLDRISYKAEEHIKSISGVSDSMQGFDREDVAAKAIQAKTQRGSVNLVKPMDNLERTDYLLARNALSIVQEFYTEPRLLTIIGTDITAAPQEVNVNQPDPVTGQIINDLTLGEYDIIITTTPHAATLEDSQFEQAVAMREIGVQIPDAVLIENSRLTRRAEILKQMQGDKESPEAQAAAALKARSDEATVAGLEADVAVKNAQAQKTVADAGKSVTDAKKAMEEGDGGMAELQKMQHEMQLKREEMDMKLEAKLSELMLKQKEMDMKLELQAREHEQKSQIRQAEAAQNAVNAEREALAKRQAVAAGEGQEESAAPNVTT